jgi:hypothetical protein
MAYTINLTNGTEIIAGGLSDGAIDTSATSLTLIGKNYAGYGEFLNENLVHMLEHFAAGTGPANPLKGQLWWDTTNNILKVYSGVSWKISTGATSAPFSSPPGDLSALGGDLWFDSTNQQLKIYSGSSWVTVGPVATPLTGDTGAFPGVMTDTLGGSHIVTQIRIVGVPYVIISRDTFNSALAGFSTIKAGLNFSTVASPSMVLSTQDIGAIPSTLVQRDPAGGINATAITGTALSVGTVQATNITGTLTGSVVGDVTAPTVAATSITTSGITATSGYTGTLLTAAQPNVTSLGALTGLTVAGPSSINGMSVGSGGIVTAGTWNAAVINPTYGGTGVNNGARTITLGGSLTTTAAWTLNQNVEINSSPTLRGTNFNSIPNGALINNSIVINGTSVPLGGSLSFSLAGTISGTPNQINASAPSGSITLSTPQDIGTASSVKFGSMNIGSATGATSGQIRASDNITAFASSDLKFKENVRPIPNALDTVIAIGGDLFDWTDEYCEARGGIDGYFVQKQDFGVVAQKVKAAFPVASRTRTDGSLAVDYEKLSALAFAAIAELRAELADLKAKIK